MGSATTLCRAPQSVRLWHLRKLQLSHLSCREAGAELQGGGGEPLEPVESPPKSVDLGRRWSERLVSELERSGDKRLVDMM